MHQAVACPPGLRSAVTRTCVERHARGLPAGSWGRTHRGPFLLVTVALSSCPNAGGSRNPLLSSVLKNPNHRGSLPSRVGRVLSVRRDLARLWALVFVPRAFSTSRPKPSPLCPLLPRLHVHLGAVGVERMELAKTRP